MIHDRIIDLSSDASIDRYYTNDGTPLTREEYMNALARETTAYTCPMCGKPTFGRFEPYVERGIDAWCSACGYMVGNKEKIAAWYHAHPEQDDDE